MNIKTKPGNQANETMAEKRIEREGSVDHKQKKTIVLN
jgi:hypothetical protein